MSKVYALWALGLSAWNLWSLGKDGGGWTRALVTRLLSRLRSGLCGIDGCGMIHDGRRARGADDVVYGIGNPYDINLKSGGTRARRRGHRTPRDRSKTREEYGDTEKRAAKTAVYPEMSTPDSSARAH